MIKNWNQLTQNAKIVCLADFFWNIGRTFPHAILTIYLISTGCSLVKIATLQTVFMITAMITEFPSGVISDIISRKSVYLCSLISLFISYLLIMINSDSFLILVIAYILYGLSVSLKSGTLEAEVVLEYRKLGKDVKEYSVASTYIMSLSSIIGGFIGSILYSNIYGLIYVISLSLFIIAFIIACFCKFEKKNSRISHGSFLCEIKTGFHILKSSNVLLYVLCLYALTTLFLQPFFQYWQVLYQNAGINIKYFGIIYVLFQVCNIIGAKLYSRMKNIDKTIYMLLIIIPLVFGAGILLENGAIYTLPLALIVFYIFYQHLDVMAKHFAPEKTMSSYFSLVGTIENISSSISLFFMAFCIEHFSIQASYLILFIGFSVLSLMVFHRTKKSGDVAYEIEI